jgi:hypothetical protein
MRQPLIACLLACLQRVIWLGRAQAQEILLLDSCPSSLLLIRFSRTEPEFLAFSYKDERGQIRHSLNKEESESKVRSVKAMSPSCTSAPAHD